MENNVSWVHDSGCWVYVAIAIVLYVIYAFLKAANDKHDNSNGGDDMVSP